MSRSNYTDDDYDYDHWSLIMWRGAVSRAIRGKRGQAFLREMIAALDAMPNKRLITEELVSGGEVCAIGSVGVQRGVDMTKLDAENYDEIARSFGIAPALVREIEWMNDKGTLARTPERRWEQMRAWAEAQLRGEGGGA